MTQNGGPAFAGCAPAVISARVMTPIVFCASLVPWASATSDDGDDLPELESASGPCRPRRAGGDPVGEPGRDQGDQPRR